MRDGHEHMWWHAHRHPWGHGYEHMWAYGHGWGPGMPYMMLSNLFWMALFIALAVILIHLLTTSNLLGEEHQSDMLPNRPSALEPLRQRYARAEIDAVPVEQVQEQQVAHRPVEGRSSHELDGVKQCPCIHPLLGFGKSGTGHNSKSTITGKTY